MTTAPDLPLPTPALAPAPADEVTRPQLRVVPTPPDSDADIVDFDEALRRLTPRLQRYAARRLLDVHEAEEVVQEASLRAFQHRTTLRTEDDLAAWLTVVTGRLVIDRVRVRSRMTPVAELPTGSRAERDTADVVVARDEARIALDALEAMPSRQAAVLWAREVEGLSYEDISERFALSEPTVRSLLHRARKTLRREYALRGGTLPSLGLVALAPWLHGLRIAGRIRNVARRGAAGAAVTATGLAAVTLVPLIPQLGSQHPAPAMLPAIGERAAQLNAAPAATATTHGVSPSAVTPASSHPVAASSSSVRVVPGPKVCGREAAINCSTHHTPTLYVGPTIASGVGGIHRVGVANNLIPCPAVPTTAVTQCTTTQKDNS